MIKKLLFLFFLSSPLLAQIPTNGLVAYYPFNGNANDESGNGNHGTVHGATLTSDRFGNSGKAYSFDGVDDWIATNMQQLNLTGYTVVGWFKTTQNHFSIIQNRGLESQGGKSLTLRYYDGKWGYSVDGDNIWIGQSTSRAHDSTWVFVVGTWDSHGNSSFNSSQFKVYINGNLKNDISGSTGESLIPNNPNGYLKIGRHDAWNQNYNGLMDDIRFYNRALSDAEVAALYAAESGSELTDISIQNLVEPINKATYTVPREATIHHYYLAKSTTTGEPIPNVVVKYMIGLDPTIRSSLPSDEDGLIDLNITTGGADPNDSNDDWIPVSSSTRPVQFHSLQMGQITGTNVFATTPFNVRVIDKAQPIDEEMGIGVGFGISADVFSVGKEKKIDVGPFKLNSGAKAGLNLGATADKLIRIKPDLDNPNIWEVYFNGGVGTSIGLEANAGFTFGGKTLKIGPHINAEAGLEGGLRSEKGYRFNLTNKADVFKLGYLIYSMQSATNAGKALTIIFEALYNTLSTSPIHENHISNSREFSYGANTAINGEVDFKLKVNSLLNLPGYGNIPESQIGIKLGAYGGFIDNLIYETSKTGGSSVTNALTLDMGVIGALEGMVSLTKGNRNNNPSVKSQPFEFFSNSFENGIIVSRSLGWDGAPKSSYFSLTSKKSGLYLNPSKPANEYNIVYSNNYNYGVHSTSRLFSAFSNNPSLEINSMASFIAMKNNSLVGSAWSTVGVSGSLYQQAYDLNTWMCTSAINSTPIYDIDMNTTRDISIIKKLGAIPTLPVLGIDLSDLKIDSWKTYTHELKRSVYSKELGRALLTVDFPNVTNNLTIPETSPIDDVGNVISNALISIGGNIIENVLNNIFTKATETIVNLVASVFTNAGSQRKSSSGELMYNPYSSSQAFTNNVPSVFTFTVPVNCFNTNTKIDFRYYYPDNEVEAVTPSDTFRIISDIFDLEATYTNTPLLTSPNSNFTINTVFSSTDLALASLPSHLIPTVLFLPKGSSIWEQIGSANTTFSFNRLGTYALGVKISNDVIPPTISVDYPPNFNSSAFIDITLNDMQSGIDWAKTVFISNNKYLPINRLGTSNTFRVNLSDIPNISAGIFTFLISTMDLAGNVKSYSNVYPCQEGLIIQSLESDPDNPILRKALKSIKSDTKTPLAKDVIFKAGNSIELQPGFETLGKTFKAEIGGCQ